MSKSNREDCLTSETFFQTFAMKKANSETLDQLLLQEKEQLVCLFLWGDNCYNCNVFKQSALTMPSDIKALPIRWLEANVYEDVALGRRFALHGIPTFIFFYQQKKLGKVSGWHGLAYFQEVIQTIQKKFKITLEKELPSLI
ncbi:thioredoxin [Pelistega indica]|uniref:Thioredoxin n=1 Tax=Pelistega indica TaxID=1414851 RepID=V8G3Q3_9BURK|nr:thioredoxin domain-containing protein [Pelistega indica]ETD71159.1 thioredoxin [Pelistega indica]